MDVEIENQGTVVLFILHTPGARDWVEANVQLESYQWLSNAAFAVGHRYADALIVGMQECGLVVK